MANGIARLGGIARNVFDMDASEVSAARKAVERAVADALPIRSGDIRVKEAEFDAGIGFAAFERLGLQALCADLDRDVRDAQNLVANETSVSDVFDDAAADNRRERAGIDMRGPGRVPYALFMRARGLDRRVQAGLISRDEALSMLASDNVRKDALALALGRFFAALDAASEAVVTVSEIRAKAQARAEAHREIGAANLYDNQRRARISGVDPTPVIAAEVSKAIAAVIPQIIKEVISASNETPLRRPDVVIGEAV